MNEPKQYIFRVIRKKVGGETVRVLLEAYKDQQRITITEGDEFITGVLKTDPWDET